MQLILGQAFTQSQFNQLSKEIKSSIVIDNVKQGVQPNQAPDGVLCTFKASPLAFHSTPTLNKMVFNKKLWSSLMENQMLRSAMESHAHFGELDHPQSPEVSLHCVCNRVNSMDFGPRDLIVGDVDLLDTPHGWIAYSLCKSGRIGISSRGFGELAPLSSGAQAGLQEVVCESYNHVSFDTVALPAVPNATMSLLQNELQKHLTQDDIADDLRRMVGSALQRWGTDPLLLAVDKALNNGKTSYSIPSSVKPQSSINIPTVQALNSALSKVKR